MSYIKESEIWQELVINTVSIKSWMDGVLSCTLEEGGCPVYAFSDSCRSGEILKLRLPFVVVQVTLNLDAELWEFSVNDTLNGTIKSGSIAYYNRGSLEQYWSDDPELMSSFNDVKIIDTGIQYNLNF